MTEDEKVTFEERKAIVMIDGQMPESYANIIAWREIENNRNKINNLSEKCKKSEKN
jgi:ABC-type metal ion transport system substrate-binding protein